MGGTGSTDASEGKSAQYDLVNNLCLIPRFSESYPDSFFSLFEWIADARDWSDIDRPILLQWVQTGKAQEAYSALSVAESKVYDSEGGGAESVRTCTTDISPTFQVQEEVGKSDLY